MKYLFWNTHKNTAINQLLCELIIENDISMIILAEYDANVQSLQEMLLDYGVQLQQYPTTGYDKITILGTVGNVELGPQTLYSSIQILNDDIILCGVHLPSKVLSVSETRRNIAVRTIVENILSTEEQLGSNNTIVVGDFNLNPYDDCMIEADFFFGLPVYVETERLKKGFDKRDFYMFYNPMWNFLGDFRTPFGTCYSEDCETYWAILDQVLIRPALRKRFVDKSLQIITETSTRFLLDSKGHPDKRISDHLPIVFELEDNNGEALKFSR